MFGGMVIMETKPATLKRSLGLWAIVLLGVGYMTPAVIFDTFGSASVETNGHVPLAYILALVAMLFTAISYGKLVRLYPSAGSAYTYTQRSISPHVGFMVGWASLLDYLFLPMINALLMKLYLLALFPEVPVWIWVTVYVAFIVSLNLYSTGTMSGFNSLLVVYQSVILLVFIALAAKLVISGMGYGEFTIKPFYEPGMDVGGLITGATLLCFSYIGFDAVSMYSEETATPAKTIPKAIFLTALIGGVMFITSSYFAQLIFPDVTKVFSEEVISDSTASDIGFLTGGKIFQIILLIGSIAGVTSSSLATHASVSRLLYVMGRDHVLPNKVFGYIHPKYRTPSINVILVGLFSFTCLFMSLEMAIHFVNFGALTAFTFVNFSVIAEFVVKRKRYKTVQDIFSYIVLPLIGATCVGVLWINLDVTALILGGSWAVIGFFYLMYLTKMFKVAPAIIHFEEADEEEVNLTI